VLRRVVGWLLFLVGTWMMVSPQAAMGLNEMKWMAGYAFPGEVLVGAVVMSAAYLLIAFEVSPERIAGEE
jgi:hypothetical protein